MSDPHPLNVHRCLMAARMYAAGKSHEGWELIKDCRGADVREAAAILDEQASIAKTIMNIGERHKIEQVGKRPLNYILKTAARAGDEEAKTMIASGILDRTFY